MSIIWARAENLYDVNVYVSISKQASPIMVEQVFNYLDTLPCNVFFYNKNPPYNIQHLDAADVILVIPPDHNYDKGGILYEAPVVGKGVYLEVAYSNRRAHYCFVVKSVKYGLMISEILSQHLFNATDYINYGTLSLSTDVFDAMQTPKFIPHIPDSWENEEYTHLKTSNGMKVISRIDSCGIPVNAPTLHLALLCDFVQ